MLVFLVFLIVLILIFGGSAVLSTLLGAVGWILGLLATLVFLVWFSTTYNVAVGTAFLALVAGIPIALLAGIYILFAVENRMKPPNKRKTFAQFWKETSGNDQ